MFDPTTMTATATAVALFVFNKAIEKGEKIQKKQFPTKLVKLSLL